MNGVSQKITIYPCYFLNKMPGTSPELFLRQTVAERITDIAERLPTGLMLVLIDGWRSYETQRFIYETTIEKFRADGYSEEKIKQEIKRFVAYPSKDRDKPAPHYTGGAIDLTIAGPAAGLR
ncbi:D-alanyl-D-alanine carboxypeptidase family protein [Terrilactibacillus sp. S3-3]|nr:D-alanyl-D-alanine carboxypeptidase family protein [Terrilactibacillus sp. S3-3]